MCWAVSAVLEQVTVDLLKQAGADKRMNEEGLPHDGIELLFKGQRHRINLHDLTGGKRGMVYGQTEVTRDLMAVRAEEGLTQVYEASNVFVAFESAKPKVRYEKDGCCMKSNAISLLAATAFTASAVQAPLRL